MSSEPRLHTPVGPVGQAEPVTAADLITVVETVAGVRGIEAGIATTLRSLDARLRRQHSEFVRYGLIIDPTTGQVTVEISLMTHRPVREIVAEVQGAVQAALHDAGREVVVRVQSLS